MNKLLIYELKKHIKLIVGMIVIIGIITYFDIHYLRNNSLYEQNSEIYNSAKSLIALFSFAFIRLFLFGLFIYFINDFMNNLMQDEKNFFFSIPLRSSEFFLAKVISVSILVILVFIAAFIFNVVDIRSLFLNIDFKGYLKFGLLNTLRGIGSLYSVCLVALLLGYFTILSIKKQLEKTRFTFLWILPFSIVFSIYFAIVQQAHLHSSQFFITPSNWYLILVNLVISLVLFRLNCHWLDKKIDI